MKNNVPSKKKVPFPVNEAFRQYLEKYHRSAVLPIQYEDLIRFHTSITLYDQHGEDTHWETVYFQDSEQQSGDGDILPDAYESMKDSG